MVKDIQLTTAPEIAGDERRLKEEITKRFPEEAHINDYRIVRRSIDARKRPVKENLTVRLATGDTKVVPSLYKEPELKSVGADAPTLIIVGAGPAGLFGALEAIRRGIRPIVLERGKDVDSRRLDIANISREKRINPESNYCFGEGGAGTYSDGKLFTRSKKRGNVEEVLQLLVAHGASEDILVAAHPHIGSDRLPEVIKNIRKAIIKNGGEVRFETLMTGLIADEGHIQGVHTDKGDILGDGVVIATGHSARDTVRALLKDKVPMEAKGIAVGVRVEHPQQLIDKIQYHSEKGRGKWLPPAEYSFVTQSQGRGVYSFCMCPGGVIVPAGSAEEELVVNGMSASARAGQWANSGMVVELHPEDVAMMEERTVSEKEGRDEKGENPLRMLEFQERLEKSFYKAAGDSIIAPAQRIDDFIEGRISKTLPKTSYAPGIYPDDFNKLFPAFIAGRLSEGLKEFGRRAKGFAGSEGIMLGLESRTSSPVRVTRYPETLASTGYPNLYPAGEGAGYAGGIVSAAIDGMRCAAAFARRIEEKKDKA